MRDSAKILLYDQSSHVLVLRRSGTHPHYPHEVDLPGGLIEQGEKPAEAVQREVFEETGLTIKESDIAFAQKRTTRYGRDDHLFIAHLTTTQPDVIVSWEHESYEWIPGDKLAETARGTKDDFMLVLQQYLAR